MDRDLRQQLMDQARAEAELGWAEGGIPIGAVLATESGEVVARGHNQRVQNGDPTSHGTLPSAMTPSSHVRPIRHIPSSPAQTSLAVPCVKRVQAG